jgi:hypothetical protein
MTAPKMVLALLDLIRRTEQLVWRDDELRVALSEKCGRRHLQRTLSVAASLGLLGWSRPSRYSGIVEFELIEPGSDQRCRVEEIDERDDNKTTAIVLRLDALIDLLKDPRMVPLVSKREDGGILLDDRAFDVAATAPLRVRWFNRREFFRLLKRRMKEPQL